MKRAILLLTLTLSFWVVVVWGCQTSEQKVEEAKGEIVSLVVAATEKVLKDHADKSITEKAIKDVNHL